MNSRTLRIYGTLVLGTLVCVELLARICDWRPPSCDFTAGDNLGESRYSYSREGFGDLVRDVDGHWVTWFQRPYHVRTNSVGLRNVEAPSEKAFRILALGDLQTFGTFLANEDTWPAWTENDLRQRDRSATRTQVFNAGIIGYTIFDQHADSEEQGCRFRSAAGDFSGIRKRPA